MKKLEDIAKLCGLNYQFGDWAQINYGLDRINTFPVLIDIMPINGNASMKSGGIDDVEVHLVCFMEKIKIQDDSKTIYDAIQRMKIKMFKFIHALNNCGGYKAIETINYTYTIDTLDCNLAGVRFELNLQPNKPICPDAI